MKKNTFYSNKFLNTSLGLLNFGESDLLIGKINSVIKEFNLDYLKSINSKIVFMTFINDLMNLTRCPELLDNLLKINYFTFIKNLFFFFKK